MINLLPPQTKKLFVAGRVNTLLVRYIWMTAGFFGLLAVISGLTYVMLENTKTNANQQINDNNSRVTDYAQIQKQTKEFQDNLATAKAILDRQTYYSGALLKIAKYLPTGTVIDKISLDSATYGTPITLHFLAVNEDQAIALKSALADSKIFSDVHFQTLNLAENGKSANGTIYRVGIEMSTTINKEGIGNESL
jgi:Tfp pilus assembly protein PilN